MKCTICKTGHTHPGITTVSLQRDNTEVVIRDVPADVCDHCGEYYLSEPVARRVYADAEETGASPCRSRNSTLCGVIRSG